MNSFSYNYPPSPVNVDRKIILPDRDFKIKVLKVTAAIIFFLFIYIILLLAASALAFLCGFGGVSLIALHPSFITVMVGLGLIGTGFFVIFFLFKFLFSKNKVNRTGIVEIKKKDQPYLFDLIKRITSEVKTSFPKKIFISPEINASVFYDSGFLSMFFPVRKNLQIGLGLVNCVTLCEFKAILSHEFGHFSQRSMKFGSYVYHVNKVIHNMLYDNFNYRNLLSGWAGASNYFTLFAYITVGIVNGIQFVMKKVYVVVNKTYLGLSRQMEFHADSVAAYISGSEPLISSLLRLEAAEICYSKLMGVYNTWIKENKKSANLYPQHAEIMHHFAFDFDVPLKAGFMDITRSTPSFFKKSRVIIKDQWASHPSVDERIRHLTDLNIQSEITNDPAWCVFSNAEELQKKLTEKIYETVVFEKEPELMNLDAFCAVYYQQDKKYRFNKIYNGFYDDRNITVFDPKKLNEEELTNLQSWEEINAQLNLGLQKKFESLTDDIAILGELEKYGIKTFDFDGKKYRQKDAQKIISVLQEELQTVKEHIEQLDKQIFRFFYDLAVKSDTPVDLAERYDRLFEVAKEGEKDLDRYNEMMQIISPVYREILPVDTIKSIIRKVEFKEKDIKERLKYMLVSSEYIDFIDDRRRNSLNEYLEKDRHYFYTTKFNHEALDMFMEAMNLYLSIVSERIMNIKKEVLDLQLTFLKNE